MSKKHTFGTPLLHKFARDRLRGGAVSVDRKPIVHRGATIRSHHADHARQRTNQRRDSIRLEILNKIDENRGLGRQMLKDHFGHAEASGQHSLLEDVRPYSRGTLAKILVDPQPGFLHCTTLP
ncbi:hypothetical protein IP86_02340 [Rhodopseudomonas sp. AAP120]|nr:hypothetical protein IP86_02340 [Rhodopseudomonas sp. AAP120]